MDFEETLARKETLMRIEKIEKKVNMVGKIVVKTIALAAVLYIYIYIYKYN